MEDNTCILVNRVETEDVTPVQAANTQGANTDSSEMPGLPLSNRTCIIKQAKEVLQNHFRMNAYPDDAERLSLSKATKLTVRTIKTWFTNTRSRIKEINRESYNFNGLDADDNLLRACLSNDAQLEPMRNPCPQSTDGATPTGGVSRASLEALRTNSSVVVVMRPFRNAGCAVNPT
jgi:hypothetical protein